MSQFPNIRKCKIKSTIVGGRTMAPNVGHVLSPRTHDYLKGKRGIKAGNHLTFKQGHYCDYSDGHNGIMRALRVEDRRRHRLTYKGMVREAPLGALKVKEGRGCRFP